MHLASVCRFGSGQHTNYSNRSPYPTPHQLREASIERAVEAFPDEAQIFDSNIENLRLLSHEGWAGLDLAANPSAAMKDDAMTDSGKPKK